MNDEERKTFSEVVGNAAFLIFFLVVIALGGLAGYMLISGVSIPLVVAFAIGSSILVSKALTSEKFINMFLEEKEEFLNLLTEEVEEEEEEEKVVKTKEEVKEKNDDIDYEQITNTKFAVTAIECNYIEDIHARKYTLNYINTLYKYYEVKKDSVNELDRLKLYEEVLSNLSLVSHSIMDFIYTETLENNGAVKKL